MVIEITDELVSAPYVLLTIGLMEKFGIKVENEDNKRFTVKAGQKYVTPGTVFVEVLGLGSGCG